MDRITHASADADLFGSGKDGFTDGDPVNGQEATVATQDFFNGVQEEVLGVIEDAGLTPSNANFAQLLNAIKTLSWRQLFAIGSNSDVLTVSTAGGVFQESAADIQGAIIANALIEGASIRVKSRTRFTVAGSGTPPTSLNAEIYLDNTGHTEWVVPDLDTSDLPTIALSGVYLAEYDVEIQAVNLVTDDRQLMITGSYRFSTVTAGVSGEYQEFPVAFGDVGDIDFTDATNVQPFASQSGGSVAVATATLEYFAVSVFNVKES